MPDLVVPLTDHQHAKLVALAEARGPRWTPERCVAAFAESCQPGARGGGSPGADRRREERDDE